MSTITATQDELVADISVNELNPCVISGTLLDQSGTAVALASVSSLVCTLYDHRADSIINSRNAQSILNTNGGTLHATSGAFTLTLSSDDNVIVSSTLSPGRQETHYALLEATWSGGGYWSGLVRIRVRQVHRAP